jgi:hypothetical protein
VFSFKVFLCGVLRGVFSYLYFDSIFELTGKVICSNFKTSTKPSIFLYLQWVIFKWIFLVCCWGFIGYVSMCFLIKLGFFIILFLDENRLVYCYVLFDSVFELTGKVIRSNLKTYSKPAFYFYLLGTVFKRGFFR